MIQSDLPSHVLGGADPGRSSSSGLHVAIIMDGSGRWAQARGLPRSAGHRAGAWAVRRIVNAAPGHGIGILTLYVFSSHNWQRPRAEVETLLGILHAFLLHAARVYPRAGVRLQGIGRRDRLPFPLLSALQRAEAATQVGERLHLRLAIDYSGREALLRAVETLRSMHGSPPADLGVLLAQAECSLHRAPAPVRDAIPFDAGQSCDCARGVPDVDLLIRTGGEQRLSDFLLWEAAYAELVFTERMWPDFGPADLDAAVREFRGRERRFGAVHAEAQAASASPAGSA